jgi:hypothetical protein
MSSTKLSERKLLEIREVAQGWGKLLAREAFPEGPGMDVSLADMEDIAAVATQAVVKGAVETMAHQQADSLGEEAACPTCGQQCKLKRKIRDVTVRGGRASLEEPVAHCWRCRRDFFPSA